MGRKNSIDKDLAAPDELIEEITTDAYGDDEQLWAFRQVINESGLSINFTGDAE